MAQRLTVHNTGPSQVPAVLMAHPDGSRLAGANFKEIVWLINSSQSAHSLSIGAMACRDCVLHPGHTAAGAADLRAAGATSLADIGRFNDASRRRRRHLPGSSLPSLPAGSCNSTAAASGAGRAGAPCACRRIEAAQWASGEGTYVRPVQ